MLSLSRWLVTAWLALFLLPAIGCDDDHRNSLPTPTATAELTATETASPSFTPTVTWTHTPTQPPTSTASPQPTATATRTATDPPTSTATSSPTETQTSTPTQTPTATATIPDAFCPDGEILVEETCAAAGAEVGFRVDIAQPENPFPDDRYRDANGRLAPPVWSFAEIADPNAVNPTSAAAFTNGLLAAIRDHATGWGNFSPIELRLTAAVDPATLDEGLLLLRYAGENWEVQPIEFTPKWYEPLHLLDLHPLIPLDSATRYAVVLTSAVKTESGAPLGRSVDFRRVLRGDEGDEVQSALDFVQSELNIGRDEVALAFTFTTQETWQDLVKIRQRLDSGDLPAPTISFEDVGSTRYTEGVFTEGPIKDQLLRGHGDDFLLAAVGTAQLYDFRGRDSIFDPAVVDGAVAPRRVPVRVEIAIPNQAIPEGGFPILFLGHGLAQSADFVWDVAAGSAELGMIPPFMIVAADFPNHGARGTGGMIGDLLQYFHLNNFYAMRDSFRQTAAELIEVRRLVETATVPPFDLVNHDRILFAGASLGGINGATFLGVDSRVRTALLSVPAGELVRILEGEAVGQQIAPFIAGLVGLTPTHPSYPDFFRLMVNRGLWIMGAGDPISYAQFVTGDLQLPGGIRKSVLIQEGLGDGVLPNVTTEDLARVMGVPIVTTEVRCDEPGCGVSGMWQFDLAEYGLEGEEPHQVSAILPEAREQLLTYLATEGQLILDASPSGD